MARHFDIARDKVLMPKVYSKFGYNAVYYDDSGDAQNIIVLARDEQWVTELDLGFKISNHSIYIEMDHNSYLLNNYMNSQSNASEMFIYYPDPTILTKYNIKRIQRIWDGHLYIAQLTLA